MKKRHWVTAALIVLAIVAAVFLVIRTRQRRREAELQHERRLAYEATTSKYSNAFPTGMSRREVEARLRSSTSSFRQMCCIDAKQDAWADLIKIGEEKPAWYCNYHNVYVALEFASAEPRKFTEAHDDDRLVKVRTFDWLETCL